MINRLTHNIFIQETMYYFIIPKIKKYVRLEAIIIWRMWDNSNIFTIIGNNLKEKYDK